MIKDRIADMLFQQVLLRPDEYSRHRHPQSERGLSFRCPGRPGGGLGMAPGANIGDDCAVFEATHGTAPKYAGLDKVNPGSLILSGALLLEHLGWQEAAGLDLWAFKEPSRKGWSPMIWPARWTGAREVSCSQFGQALIERLG